MHMPQVQTNKNEKQMAKLIEVANVAPELMRIAQCVEVRKRNASTYIKRMDALRSEANVFKACKTARPKNKYRNRVHSEKAGTIAPRLTTKRFDNSHTTIVCRTTRIY